MRFVRTLAITGFLAAAVGAQEAARPEPWRLIQPPQSSLVYARDGSLIGEIGREMRTSVPLASLPRYVPQAFVAVEDQRFYQHDGVDVVGIAGAIKDNLLGASRGASTITQQLVGNIHPDIIDRRDRSLARKLREQAAAREMEKRYSKAQILEAYLNQISFGRGWFGIEAASRHYFGKPARELTLPEAASLAALPKAPATYDPARHPARNKNRRDAILDLMVAQRYITAAEGAAAKRTPVRTVPEAGYSVAAPYFVDVVRQQLERAGVPVMNGGYRIVTTLEPALQRAAQAALADGLAAIEARPGYRHLRYAGRPRGRTDYLQGAVVAMDPATGDVRALVGGRDYAEGPYNRAVNAMRQPGSAFKPIVYAAAIKDSLPANALVADTAITVTYDRVVYRPRNADGEFLGALTLRDALARSRNPVAVQLWERVSADSVIALARRMGISAPIAPYPSSAIGASAVRPIDLVAAFTTFANLGTPVEPRFVLRVEDRTGRVVYSQGVTRLPAALDTATAYIVRDLMRDAVDRGTATAVRRYLSGAVAGKTGTTDDVTDVWFLGLTPDLVAGVWLGFDRPTPILAGGSAGGLAAPIFGQMVAQAGRARGADAWAPPAGVVAVDLERPLGALATATTPADRRYTEYFLPGTEPGALRLDARRLFRWGPISF